MAELKEYTCICRTYEEIVVHALDEAEARMLAEEQCRFPRIDTIEVVSEDDI